MLSAAIWVRCMYAEKVLNAGQFARLYLESRVESLAATYY